MRNQNLPPNEELPTVTIQLPIFNEQYVAARVIEGALKIDFPRTKLEIQVLDDSTDETLEISSRLVKKYRALGYRISLLHRRQRTGQKAGALLAATAKASGDYILIFDADFIPAPAIVKALLPGFLENTNIGMIQARWGHLNSNYSPLTRAQGVLIDSHFAIEQVARGGSQLLMTFNGTAGMWRKQCIIDAGNWHTDTLTEDCDLSYRAGLKGWELGYYVDVENPAELPVQLNAYKIQQFRWAKGSIQTALKLLKKVFTSNRGVYTKIEAFFHMTNYLVHPLLILNILFSLPITANPTLAEVYTMLLGSSASIFAFAVFIPILFFIYGQKLLHRPRADSLKNIPLAVILGTGMAVNNTWAVLEALFGKPSEFLRTPKHGVVNQRQQWWKKKYSIKNRFPVSMLLEFILGCASVFGIWLSCIRENYFALPFYCLYSTAFLFVFFMAIYQNNGLKYYKTIEKKI